MKKIINEDLKKEEVENLSLFGTKEVKITQEEIERAKLLNEKDKEPLDVPTFISGQDLEVAISQNKLFKSF